MYAVFDSNIVVTELFRSFAERYVTNIIKLVYWDILNIEAVRNNMKSMTLCSELLRETFSQILENLFLKQKVRLEEVRGAVGSNCYRQKVVDVLRREI